MAASIETKRKLRYIRSISAPFPDRTAEERIKRIADIASGNVELTPFENHVSPTLMQRLAAGQASRSVRTARDKRPAKVEPEPEPDADEEPKPKKRKLLGGYNREERGGLNRSEDVNL